MNSTPKVFFYARKNYVNKDGEVGVMVRIVLDGQKTQFSSKQTILLEMWDAKENMAIGKSAKANFINIEYICFFLFYRVVIYRCEKTKAQSYSKFV